MVRRYRPGRRILTATGGVNSEHTTQWMHGRLAEVMDGTYATATD